MSTNVPDFWWPIDFSERGLTHFLEKKQSYANTKANLDRPKFDITNSLIEKMMRTDLQEILDRDSIPNLCHVLNGWGNSQFKGKDLLGELAPFIFINESKNPFIEQCTPEGDFHPWQSFAYSAMAGIEGDALIGNTEYSLKDLMKNSTRIHHFEGEELGHLLFAFAYYFRDKIDENFQFNNGNFDITKLLEWAVENHFTGEYRVCRKFHLTEGICAMASLNKNFNSYRLVAQKFLEGQVDLIILIGSILEESLNSIENGIALEEDSIVHEYRDQLVVLDYLENHVYYAGHIIELASLGILMGYEISTAQRNAIITAINCINKIIPVIAPKMSFVDCFLGFGHYRRAITLFREIDENAHDLDWSVLTNYKLNFDQISPIIFDKSDIETAKIKLSKGVFQVVDPLARINPNLLKIILDYDKRDFSITYPLRGKFAHFRRVCPVGWPKSVHFEILDYGEKIGEIGLEIHLESEEVKFIKDSFENLKTMLENEFEGKKITIDDKWYNGLGRLTLIYSFQENSTEEITDAFIRLIKKSEELITRLLISRNIKTQ